MSKSHINLPKTAFSMKANLAIREPEILKYWEEINLYQEPHWNILLIIRILLVKKLIK